MLWLRAIILVSLLLLGLNIQSVSLVEANGSIRSYEKKVIGKYIIGSVSYTHLTLPTKA